MKSYFSIVLIFLLFIFNGCNEEPESNHSKAVKYCIEENGTVIHSESSDEELCQYQVEYQYDDGIQMYTSTCELYTFYENEECDNLEDEDTSDTILLSTRDRRTVGEAFHSQVLDILKKLDHTGYTHKTDGPFVLHPNYTELTYKDKWHTEMNTSIESYNLFLDCSGFVGYYVVQGVAKSLYSELNTCYHSSRPLAADFADTFASAEHNVSDHGVHEALLSELDHHKGDIHWGRVPTIGDAKAGDIIVYKHPENITSHGECNNTVTGNTGHVLFIMSDPKPSTKYSNEWLVHVADSTTAPHSKDSRYSNKSNGHIKDGSKIYNKSEYDSNTYTAWSKRYKKGDIDGWWPRKYKHDDWLELCKTDDNNTFHRRCSDFDENRLLKIHPQTGKTDSSTGIGIGYIYIDGDMQHYRVKRGTKKKAGQIYIGRPIRYK